MTSTCRFNALKAGYSAFQCRF